MAVCDPDAGMHARFRGVFCDRGPADRRPGCRARVRVEHAWSDRRRVGRRVRAAAECRPPQRFPRGCNDRHPHLARRLDHGSPVAAPGAWPSREDGDGLRAWHRDRFPVAAVGSQSARERGVQVRAVHPPGRPRDGAADVAAAVLRRWRGRDGGRPGARRHALARHRREGRRVEHG